MVGYTESLTDPSYQGQVRSFKVVDSSMLLFYSDFASYLELFCLDPHHDSTNGW